MLLWLLPFIAALGDALSIVTSKQFLRRFGRLTYREFNWLVFVGIVLVASGGLFFFETFPSMEHAISLWPSLGGLILLASLGNILFFQSLEQERVSMLEPFIVFSPLATILIVSAIYPTERHWIIYMGILLAALVLYWANLHGQQLRLSRGLLLMIGFWVTYGLESALVKNLLTDFGSLELYWLRCIGVLTIFTIFYPPKWSWLRPHHFVWAGLLGLIAVATMVVLYTGFGLFGVANTLFVMVLSPILVYLFSTIILRDRWSKKNLLASLIVVLLVVGVSLVSYLAL